MTDNGKKKALMEMKGDLQEIRESLIEIIMKETDSNRLENLYRTLHDVDDVKYHLACVHDFLEPLYR